MLRRMNVDPIRPICAPLFWLSRASFALLSCVLVAFAAGCGGGKDATSSSSPSGKPEKTETVVTSSPSDNGEGAAGSDSREDVASGEGVTEPAAGSGPKDEVEITVRKEGDGPELPADGIAIVHYTGYTLDGKEFDSSRGPGRGPFSVDLGANPPPVIQGWVDGLQGMKVGEQRKLLIPASLAYGERGHGQQIPPNADLLFFVELVEIGGGADK